MLLVFIFKYLCDQSVYISHTTRRVHTILHYVHSYNRFFRNEWSSILSEKSYFNTTYKQHLIRLISNFK